MTSHVIIVRCKICTCIMRTIDINSRYIEMKGIGVQTECYFCRKALTLWEKKLLKKVCI